MTAMSDAMPDADALPLDVTPMLPRRPKSQRAGASKTAKAAKQAAFDLPVARVAVDVQLPHLDRPFDYLVAQSQAAQAVPGVRVRVRFAGKLVDGFVVERVGESEHEGRLAFLDRVVSPEVVLSAPVLALARAVADRWAGTLADVLRLAVPPRHARVEAEPRRAFAAAAPAAEILGWTRYRRGESLVAALRDGGSPRAVWVAAPGGVWPREIAELVAATLSSGRGALVITPDGGSAAAVSAALSASLGQAGHVVLTADLGPAERYRRFLALSRGDVRVVVGLRAAAFAPVAALGLIVVWDDGSDLHAEPRAPYPHAREVSLLRAQHENAAVVIGGHAMTAEGARLLATGWAHEVAPDRATLRRLAPRVVAADDAAASTRPSPAVRLPTLAWRAAHDALGKGLPVLVQAPRGGYLAALSCQNCRAPLRCPACAGPLLLRGEDLPLACGWCGRLAGGWRCPECGSARYRAAVVGVRRTAEELGRAFPGVVVRTSAGEGVLDRVPPGASITIATPGAEPVVEGGYGAALLLDGWAMLQRADLRAGEETLRRWLNAASLTRPAPDGGVVVALADASVRPVQALVRWDPRGHAERELADRVALGFPPATVFAEVVGEPDAVDGLLAVVTLPKSAGVLGPVPVAARDGGRGESARALIRAPRSAASDLATALRQAQGMRSARKLTPARVRIDPIDIG